jgi:hypothetical protein
VKAEIGTFRSVEEFLGISSVGGSLNFLLVPYISDSIYFAILGLGRNPMMRKNITHS